MSESAAIELNAVEKRYGDALVVAGVDCQVLRGECFVLIGPNGAGKTTMMKLMLGLTRPSSGQVRVFGDDPAGGTFTARRQSLGYLPENVSFYYQMTGMQLLRYYARLKRAPDSEVAQRLAQVGLHDAANKRLNTYSKGMRQRLGLAQAILGAPELLFLDEPTTGLDPSARRDFYQLLNELRSGGTTVVISSHSLSEMEATADRVALVRGGRLLACGSLQELRRQADLPVQERVVSTPGLDEIYLHFMNREAS